MGDQLGGGIARFHHDAVSCFQVGEVQQSTLRQRGGVGIMQHERDHVMAEGEAAERGLPALREEVGEKKDHAAARRKPIHRLQRYDKICGQIRRALREQDMQQAPDGARTLARRKQRLDAIAECQHPCAVVALGSGERQQRRDLRAPGAYAVSHRAECRGCADIQCQQHRAVPFLDEPFDEGSATSGGHIPVDEAQVVTGQVGAQLRKLQATPAKGGAEFPSESLTQQSARSDLQRP